jgi:hypothetical protein
VFAEKVILVSLRSLTFFLMFCYGFIIVGSLMMDLGGGSEGEGTEEGSETSHLSTLSFGHACITSKIQVSSSLKTQIS